jgi:hypothetical protein
VDRGACRVELAMVTETGEVRRVRQATCVVPDTLVMPPVRGVRGPLPVFVAGRLAHDGVVDATELLAACR